MYAKLPAIESAINNWICTTLHKRWWKAEWIVGDTRIKLSCEQCGRVY